MATINFTTLGSSMIDTSLSPDVTIERADGLTTPATGESVVIRSTFTQEITGFGGGIVFFSDAKDLTGSTEASTPTGAGTVFEQVVNLPQGSAGIFEYAITANSAYTGSKYGPPSTRILRVLYNTETPDVVLSRALQNTERNEHVDIEALWNHAVTGFDINDVQAVWVTEPAMQEGTIDNFGGNGLDVYSVRVNFPDNVRGEVEIIVPANSATSVINSAKDGPPVNRSITIPFDRTAGDLPEVPPAATLEISKPLAETYRLKRYTTRFLWSRVVTAFLASDVDVDVLSGSGTVVESTLIEDPNTEGLYTMQLTLSGSGRVRVRVQANMALAGTVQSPEADVEVEWDFDVKDATTTVDGVTELCNETFAIDDNPYLDSVLSFSGDHAGGAFFGVSDLIVHNNKVYGVVQIRKRAEGREDELAVTEQAGAALFMVDGSSGCRVLKAYPFVSRAARSLVVHDDAVHFFEGSHYQYYRNWIPRTIPTIKEIGYVYRIDKDSNRISEVGLNWRSVLPSTEDSRVEGLHGGTASPMLSTPEGLQVFAGWGDLDNVTEGLDPNTGRFPISTDIENWQWVEHNNLLDFIVSELQTNGKRAWQVLEDLARLTNSVIGYFAGQFVFQSRHPLKATLDETLGATSITSITYDDANRAFPDSGMLSIGGEVFRYTGKTDTTFTGISRAQERTDASGHMQGADIYFVHAVLDANAYAEPINELSLKADTTRVYNRIQVLYGDSVRGERRKAVASSQSSIDLHGKQVFEISTELDHHQVQWAQWLADSLLDYYSDRHLEITLQLQHTVHVDVTDVVLVVEPHRTSVSHLAQIQSISPNYQRKTTELRVRTL